MKRRLDRRRPGVSLRPSIVEIRGQWLKDMHLHYYPPPWRRQEHGRGAILDPLGCKVCDVECAAGVLVGGRTVCPGSLGGGKGPKCRGER